MECKIKLGDNGISNPFLEMIPSRRIDCIDCITMDPNNIINAMYEQGYDLKSLGKIKQLNNIELHFDVEYRQDDESELSEIEDQTRLKYIEDYKKDIEKTTKHKDYFIRNYGDPTILKDAHLTNTCGMRKDENKNPKITSQCSMKEFIGILGKENKKNICKKMECLLKQYNVKINKPITIGNTTCCFFIYQVYRLICYYIETLEYCVKILDKYPYLSRKPKLLFKSIDDFIVRGTNEFIIKHYNFIPKIKIKNNDAKTTRIRFSKTQKSYLCCFRKSYLCCFRKSYLCCKTQKRNDVYFLL